MAYADDLMELAENKKMRSVIERLERYLDRKRLEVNTEKTKIMKFRKGGGKEEKRDWRWKRRAIEEVILLSRKEFKYLGYVLQKNANQEAHVRDRIKRAVAAMG